MTVLANEPLGSFMVRNSESQPGTLALSVRVPKAFHPLGITHYIIVKLEQGYQIKVGFRVPFSIIFDIIIYICCPVCVAVSQTVR